MGEHKVRELELVNENQKAGEAIAEATKSGKRCCLNCRYAKGDPVRLFNGSCHRYPPSVFPMQSQNGQVAGMNMWPPVAMTQDVCGEFAAEVKIVGASRLPEAG
jgi:hypothetical protein